MSNPYDEHEQAQKIKEFITTNGIPILIAIAVSIAGIIGWRWFQDYRQESAELASSHYQDFLTARGLKEPLEDYIETFGEEYPKSAYRIFALLYDAKSATESEDWPRALSILENALELAGGTAMEDLIRTRKARVEVQLEAYEEALATLAEVKGAGFLPRAAELSGDIHRVRGEHSLAREAYQKALDTISPSMSPGAISQKLASLPAAS